MAVSIRIDTLLNDLVNTFRDATTEELRPHTSLVTLLFHEFFHRTQPTWRPLNVTPQFTVKGPSSCYTPAHIPGQTPSETLDQTAYHGSNSGEYRNNSSSGDNDIITKLEGHVEWLENTTEEIAIGLGSSWMNNLPGFIDIEWSEKPKSHPETLFRAMHGRRHIAKQYCLWANIPSPIYPRGRGHYKEFIRGTSIEQVDVACNAIFLGMKHLYLEERFKCPSISILFAFASDKLKRSNEAALLGFMERINGSRLAALLDKKQSWFGKTVSLYDKEITKYMERNNQHFPLQPRSKPKRKRDGEERRAKKKQKERLRKKRKAGPNQLHVVSNKVMEYQPTSNECHQLSTDLSQVAAVPYENLHSYENHLLAPTSSFQVSNIDVLALVAAQESAISGFMSETNRSATSVVDLLPTVSVIETGSNFQWSQDNDQSVAPHILRIDAYQDFLGPEALHDLMTVGQPCIDGVLSNPYSSLPYSMPGQSNMHEDQTSMSLDHPYSSVRSYATAVHLTDSLAFPPNDAYQDFLPATFSITG